MSSLWTPGGEVPIERRPSAEPHDPPAGAPGATAAGAPGPAEVDDAAMQAAMAEVQAQMLQAPAADVIGQELMVLVQVAVLHLSQPDPRIAEVRLCIDAVAAVVSSLGDRLGPVGDHLRSLLPDLQMACVQASGAPATAETETETEG